MAFKIKRIGKKINKGLKSFGKKSKKIDVFARKALNTADKLAPVIGAGVSLATGSPQAGAATVDAISSAKQARKSVKKLADTGRKEAKRVKMSFGEEQAAERRRNQLLR